MCDMRGIDEDGAQPQDDSLSYACLANACVRPMTGDGTGTVLL